MQAAELPDSFIVFEWLRVDELKLRKSRPGPGSVHTAASVAGESVNLRDKRIKMPLDLQRTSQGWLLRKPQPVYLSKRAGISGSPNASRSWPATTPTRSSRHA